MNFQHSRKVQLHQTALRIARYYYPTTNSNCQNSVPCKLKTTKFKFEFILQQGLCGPSKSRWASFLHFVLKKIGDWRPRRNYRKTNKIIQPYPYPIPFLQGCRQFLHEATVFSTIDLIRACQPIPFKEENIPKTAIITPFGLFEFPFMAFVLRNAAQIFQRFIDEVVLGLDFCFIYLDDIIVKNHRRTP